MIPKSQLTIWKFMRDGNFYYGMHPPYLVEAAVALIYGRLLDDLPHSDPTDPASPTHLREYLRKALAYLGKTSNPDVAFSSLVKSMRIPIVPVEVFVALTPDDEKKIETSAFEFRPSRAAVRRNFWASAELEEL